jgi:hypothetical protein
MSVDKRRVDGVKGRREEPPRRSPASLPARLVGRLKAYTDRWAELYIEQRVTALTGD